MLHTAYMRRRPFFIAAALATAEGVPATAADAASPKTAPKLSIDVEAVSDYRFRGVSLSGGEPAVQAGALIELDSGVFASIWVSTLSGGDLELQPGVGYSADIADKLNLEVGISYNVYPAEPSQNYYEAAAALSYSFAGLTPTIAVEYAPKQAHLRDEAGLKQDNLYGYLALDISLPRTPVTLAGQIGYETGLFDTRANGGKWDWLIGARAQTKWLNFGIIYVDSNGRVLGRRGRDLADKTVVASIGRSF